MSDVVNMDLECGLLGCLLMNNNTLNNIEHIITPDDFSSDLNGAIYERARDMISAGDKASAVTMKMSFADDWEWLSGLYDGACAPVSITSYAKGIKDLSTRRQLISNANEFADCMADCSLEVPEIASQYVASLDDALTSTVSTRQTVGDAALGAIERLESDAEASSVSTGLNDLDRALGGYYRGEYVIIAARPGMGKSMFCASTMRKMATAGTGVHYISLEMTREALAQRCLSDIVYNPDTPIPYIDMRRRDLGQNSIERLKKAQERLSKASLVIEDAPGLTVPEIAARARAQQQRFQRAGKRLDILCVDHIGKVKPSGNYNGQKVNEVGEISGDLACLAKSLDCTVIALSQLNRSVESQDRKNKRPNLSDLRNSGDIEQDADVVLFLYRTAYYLEKMECDDQIKEGERLDKLKECTNKLEIIVSKQRAGPCYTVHAFADMGSNAVRDMVWK